MIQPHKTRLWVFGDLYRPQVLAVVDLGIQIEPASATHKPRTGAAHLHMHGRFVGFIVDAERNRKNHPLGIVIQPNFGQHRLAHIGA